uniref:GNAT family N-acetyltransferase n=1 Tax=Phenylobacterium glaciei TaxID=2803784 RepID=A0A974S782_9CAUL|nr:GNAT family N-acetyltransferase [Phenylobacterium glaciei]
MRPTEAGDAQRMAQIQSNWKVTRMLRLAPWPATQAAMVEWADLHGQEWAAGTAYRFAVLLDRVMIGAADIDDIDGPMARSAIGLMSPTGAKASPARPPRR